MCIDGISHMLHLISILKCLQKYNTDLTLKWKVIVYTKIHDETAEHTFYINGANICDWRKNYNLIFSCKATIKYFTWMKGKYPEVHEGLLDFVTKIHVKGWPSSIKKWNWREKEIVKSLRINKRNFRAGRLV